MTRYITDLAEVTIVKTKKEAKTIANQNNETDDEWNYVVIATKGGYRIDVVDTDGHYLGSL